MRAQDIMKLAKSRLFDIYRLNENNEGLFTLKHMVGEDFPSWEVIANNISYNEVMNLYHTSESGNKYPLLCWKEFTTFDLIKISKAGFRIWKEPKTDIPTIEEYNPMTLSWSEHKTFNTLQEKIFYLNHQLVNPLIVVVD